MKYGFTLIELMIVVAIIGILACTAVPLYNGYIREASRAEANTLLADIAAKEEVYHGTWNTYLAAAGSPLPTFGTRSPQPIDVDGNWAKLGFPASVDGGIFGGPVYFRYQVTLNANGDGYTITAQRNLINNVEQATMTNTNRRTVAYAETHP